MYCTHLGWIPVYDRMVESHLYPTALGVVDDEDVLEGGNEWIGDVVGKAPQSEEGCDQNEWEEKFPWNDRGGCVGRHVAKFGYIFSSAAEINA